MRSRTIRRVFVMAAVSVLLACDARGEAMPYAGWAVGYDWAKHDGHCTILRSTDSGNTWIRQGIGQVADVTLEGVFAVDPYTAWAVGHRDGGYGTIYHTADGGSTWERKGSPADVPDVGLAKVHTYGDSKVWAVGTGAIMHTSDGGATWTNQLPHGYGYENVLLQGVYTLDGNTVWVTGGDCDGYALILKSTDAGQHWTRQSATPVGGPPLPDHLLGISAADADTGWTVGGDYSVWKTTDGGAEWMLAPNFPSGAPYDVNEVYAVDTETVWVAADWDIYWSTDAGATWDKAGNHDGPSIGDYTMGISAVSDQEAWGCVDHHQFAGSIAHTTDGGNTWTVVDHLHGEPLPGMMNISFATQPIPEPATLALLALGVFALALRHRWTR